MEISPANLKKVVSSYIPNQLLPAEWSFSGNDTIQNLQNLLNNSDGKLQMFGSAQELAQALIKYISFPGSYRYFNIKIAEHFYTCPPTFDKSKNQIYLYKTDICAIFEGMIPCPLTNSDATLANQSVRIYLKKMQSKLGSYSEIAEIPDDSLNVPIQSLLYYAKNFSEQFLETHEASDQAQVRHFTQQDFFAYWKLILNLSVNDGYYEEIFKLLKNFIKKFPAKYNAERYAKIIFWIKLVVREFENFLKEHSIDFFPNFFTKVSVKKPIVRLFSEQKEIFVMAHELLQSMKNARMDVSSFEQEVLGMPKLATFSFREVVQKVNKNIMKAIKFVRTPIVHSNIAATPIPTIDGGHCILASHAFFELLSKITDSNKTFQIIDKEQWSSIEVFFSSLEQYFHVSNGIYFIDMKDVTSIKNKWDNCFKRLSTSSRSDEEREHVRKNIFTVTDLKNGLEFLELNQIFPEITDHAESAYQEYIEESNGFPMRTSEMYRAIDLCQQICILARLPKIAQFLYHQNACSLVECCKCVLCTGSIKSSTVEVIKEASESIVSGIEKRETGIVTESAIRTTGENSIETFPVETDTKNCVNSENERKDSGINSETAVETNELPTSKEESSQNYSVGMKNKTKKVKKQKSSVNNSKSVDIKPEEKESNSCPKCYRANEFHKEQLRQSKMESNLLKKKLSEIKKENTEKDEKIRLLEEKLLAQEQKSLKEKEENEKRIQGLEQLLQSQEKKLTEQNETIKNLKESVNRPSSSSDPDQEVLPKRSPEESEKVRVVLYNLLDIQDILHIQNSVSKASEITNRLVMKADRKNAQLRANARQEFRKFSHQYNIYVESVEKNLEMIRNNQAITANEIPALPQFPSFSEEFLNAYKDTMKSDAPIICEALLKPAETQEANPDELDDKECVICIIKIQPTDETLKCETCKRRFHSECASEWLQVKRACPTCRATLLDPNEFPALQ